MTNIRQLWPNPEVELNESNTDQLLVNKAMELWIYTFRNTRQSEFKVPRSICITYIRGKQVLHALEKLRKWRSALLVLIHLIQAQIVNCVSCGISVMYIYLEVVTSWHSTKNLFQFVWNILILVAHIKGDKSRSTICTYHPQLFTWLFVIAPKLCCLCCGNFSYLRLSVAN